MSRYYNESVNGRGNTVGIGGRGNAGQCHLRGWDVGVRVVPHTGSGPDRLDIYLTGGSHAAGQEIFLGSAVNTPTGHAFMPNPVGLERAAYVPPTDPSGNGPIAGCATTEV